MMGVGEISAYKSFIVRDGSRIRFWHDVGVANRPQKNCFQIVFDCIEQRYICALFVEVKREK